MSSRSATVRASTDSGGSAAASSRAAGCSSPAITRLTSVPPWAAIGVVSELKGLALLLDGEGVEPTLGLTGAAPSPRPLGLTWRRGAGARPAADARVPLVEQRVIRHPVFPDVAPHVRPTPMRQRKHFHDRSALDLVILDDLRRRARGRLILSHRADPRIEPGDRSGERLDLANRAAAVRVRLVQRTRVGQGFQVDDVEAVALGEALFERVRLGEMERGVEERTGTVRSM